MTTAPEQQLTRARDAESRAQDVSAQLQLGDGVRGSCLADGRRLPAGQPDGRHPT